MLEKYMNKGKLPGKGPLVAAFASTNLGDVSPNTKGPHCLDTGLPCDLEHSTCNGRNELCVGSGPGIIWRIQNIKERCKYAKRCSIIYFSTHDNYHFSLA